MQIRTRELFQSIRTEGGLLPSDLLRRLAEADPELQGLTADSYHLDSGARLGEVISRGWNRLLGAWAAFDAARRNLSDDDTGGQLTRNRWLHIVFDEFGYGRLVSQPAVEIDDKSYPIFAEWNHTPIHMVGCNVALDRRTPGVRGASGQSPHSLVQELLNRSPERLWGMVSNGLRLRLVRDNVALTRQAYVEFDLEAMMIGEAYSDFVVLWLVCHQSRVESERPEECWLEHWSTVSAERGARALDALRTGVEEAIATLGRGFLAHPDNHHLHEALRSGALDAQDYYRQLLRLVYRLLFLFVAEDRDALLDPDAEPTTRERYLRHYSTQHLRLLADRRRGGQQHDLYTALNIVMEQLGNSGCQPLGLPALGSYLWSREALCQLADATVANSELLSAIRDLAWIEEHGVRRVVDFRHLGAEELGSVYESLLELHPELDRETATFTLKTSNGSDRKTTGSYYTPTDLITTLLDSALEPILDEAAKSADPEAAILELTVCDPACGSGHFLIAAANRIGKRLAAIRTGDSEPSPEAMRHALRDVTGSCIYGVDMNPMAVELCKVSLWMEALDPGRPLSFLDDRIVCGNSLLGATPELIGKGIPAGAFKPLLGDDKEVVAELRKRNSRELKGQITLEFTATLEADTQILGDRSVAITQVADDSLRGVRERERQFQDLVASPELERARLLADVWCAAFVVPKRPGEPTITQDVLHLVAAHGSAGLSAKEHTVIEDLRDTYGFHHWHVAFPAVFAAGGFDVVLGNPPWEHTELKEKEFFANTHPDIATARTAAIRKRLIAELIDADPVAHRRYVMESRRIDGINHFVRQSSRYPLTARGRINTYAIFAEDMCTIVQQDGTVALIAKSGLFGDLTYADFLSDCLRRDRLATVLDFDNRDRIFPGVQGNVRFSLVVLRPHSGQVSIAAKLRSVRQATDPDRRYTFTVDQLHALNPDVLTLPLLGGALDAALLVKLHESKSRLTPDGWLGRPSTMINMATESGDFRVYEELRDEGFSRRGGDFIRDDQCLIPVYESKFIAQFDHRAATFDGVPREQRFKVHAGARRSSEAELSDQGYCVTPRYWVPQVVIAESHAAQHDWVLAFRDAISATADARSAIAAIVPRSACGHTLPIITTDTPSDAGLLLAVINSFVFDYIIKQKVSGGHLVIPALQQAALPPREVFLNEAWNVGQSIEEWILDRVVELTVTAVDVTPFAAQLGREAMVFQRIEPRRVALRAELDAAFFQLYEMSRDDAAHILDTFLIVRRRDEKLFGEYRTKRMILEHYDAMAVATASGSPYESILDPSPADPSLVYSSGEERVNGAVVIPLPFRRVENPPETEQFRSVVPIQTLKAAAGAFGAGEAVQPDGWAKLNDGPTLREGMFIAEVAGHSMEPRIPDGAWCLFASPIAAGPNNGDILLVENRSMSDPDTGGSYALKRYSSKKVRDDELWENEEITLESLNPKYGPIVLRPEHDGEVRVIAEFVCVIG
jgi:Peptidase S24-like/N-6 DNA Methylase